MSFFSLPFYALLGITFITYYIIPLRFRWIILLASSIAFYYFSCPEGIGIFLIFIVVSYGFSLWIDKARDRNSDLAILLLGWALALLPLTMVKWSSFIGSDMFIIPLGMSFFSLQIVAYLTDIYKGKIEPQKNIFRYALFISWFPQIIQGPIPRYEQLDKTLYGNRLDPDGVTKGFQLIIWGWFIILVIADKAAVLVNSVFDAYKGYSGFFVLIAGMLYCLQLYTDFSGCVCIAKGISELFGIHLPDNFNHPFFSQNIRDFWNRWHISLSTWLRDYIYFPLGGSRKGKMRQYLNIMIVFVISGLWHGNGMTFVIWGIINGLYRIIGDITWPWRKGIYDKLHLDTGNIVFRLFRTLFTSFLVMIAFIMFRADTVEQGIYMISSLFSSWNPWVLSNGSMLLLGLDRTDWIVLGMSTALLVLVSCIQEKGICIRDKVMRMPFILRWVVYLTAIVIIVLCGTYGFGFNTADFIYGGF